MPPKTSKFERAVLDFYPSPPGVVEPLLRAVFFEPGKVWEPCAGDGALVDQLHAAGHEVVASDIVDRGHPDVISGVDFLKINKMPRGVSSLISNPPYTLAQEFVEHALHLGVPQIAMLLNARFLLGAGPRWKITRQVSDVLLMGRLKMLPPGAIDAGHSGMQDHAWIVFRPGPPQLSQRWHNGKKSKLKETENGPV